MSCRPAGIGTSDRRLSIVAQPADRPRATCPYDRPERPVESRPAPEADAHRVDQTKPGRVGVRLKCSLCQTGLIELGLQLVQHPLTRLDLREPRLPILVRLSQHP